MKMMSQLFSGNSCRVSSVTTAAYLANFYTTVQFEHLKAIRLCNDVLSRPVSSNVAIRVANTCVSEFLFRVQLSTRWLQLFDSRLQTVWGFFTLAVLNRTKRKENEHVVLLCPILFIHYIKTWCLKSNGASANEISASIDAFYAHQYDCVHLAHSFALFDFILRACMVKSSANSKPLKRRD